jgi:PPM family protein phosphatase
MMALEIACDTDVGMVRHENEDYLAINQGLGVAVLADGMGGYQAGEVASRLAVDTILNELQSRAPQVALADIHSSSGLCYASLLLQQAILHANQAIWQAACSKNHYHGMGTTVVAVWFYGEQLSIAHVGDSRLYRLRDNELKSLTKDHSVLQQLIDVGLIEEKQAWHAPNRNLITRALGVKEQVEVDLQEHKVHSNDLYLLCSDGLNDMLQDIDIFKVLNKKYSALEIANQLIALANQHGGKDNISVIVIKLQQTTQQTWWKRFLTWLSQ